MNNNKIWINHLNQWRNFLNARLETTNDEGEAEKIKRQITVIERVRYSAVLNPELIIEFINPGKNQIQNGSQPEFFLPLNESQREAVATSLNTEQNLSLIQGPPGTGKTQVITELCLQLYRNNPNIRILVCSETHIAVNNLIQRIADNNPMIRTVRIRDKEKSANSDRNSPEAIFSQYLNWLTDTCDDADIVNIISESIPHYENKGFEKSLALSANVVGMTCNRAGAYLFLDSTEMFDYAIIDEVCKATLPEILIPLSISKRAILVGDPQQLPPVFCSEDLEIIRSLEKCNLNDEMYIDKLFHNSDNTVILNTQYRMEKKIGQLISDLFYSGTLLNGRNYEQENSLIWIDYNPAHMWPEEQSGASTKPIIRNLEEVQIIDSVLHQISDTVCYEKTVAVISPYRQQVYELRTKLSDYENLNITIDTVDGFQGKESDIVIFGVTRTTGPFRFLSDQRRLNVALSRARDQIIIVGYKQYARKNYLLSKIINACKIQYYESK